MFGYIAADTRKLNKSQKQDYRSIYCGLCHALGRRYGFFSRFMLSFDTAFLLMLLERDGAVCNVRRCPLKPFEKCSCASGRFCDYCADVTVLLFCLKLEDDIDDDNSLVAKILLRLFSKQFEKAKSNQPELTNKIKLQLEKLRNAEQTNEQNPDVGANIFGKLLSDVFEKDKKLSRLGFLTGRFIYLADAVCDFKADLKHARYNPLVRKRKSEFYTMLASELGAIVTELDTLNIKNYRDIIENVLYHGVWIKINAKGIYDNGSV